MLIGKDLWNQSTRRLLISASVSASGCNHSRPFLLRHFIESLELEPRSRIPFIEIVAGNCYFVAVSERGIMRRHDLHAALVELVLYVLEKLGINDRHFIRLIGIRIQLVADAPGLRYS